MRNKILISLLIIVLIFVSGCVIDSTTKSKSNGITTERESSSANLRQVTLKIEGMIGTCCEYNIKNSLKYVDGVTQADISFSEGGGKVVYDSTKTTKEDIVNAIPESFTVTIIEDERIKK